MIKYVSAALLPLIMIGCGSSGSSGSSVGTGYYVDSPVEGVSYVCGNQSGLTDVDGMFKFESGKACSFSINNFAFKTVDASDLSDEVTIQETDLNTARFLQTLDNDGNPDNGISIKEEVLNAVTKIPTTAADFSTLDTVLAAVPSYEGKPVSAQDARDHLDKSIAILTAVATVTSATFKQGDEITLSASDSTISKGTIASYEWLENGTRISTNESFSKSDFGLGNHTLTLIIKDENGIEATTEVTFSVLAASAPTKWDDVNALSESMEHKLYMTSDAQNIYIKLEGEDLNSFQFFIDSDNSRVSGLQTGTYANNGLDYVIKNDGFYKLLNPDDFSAELIQAMSYQSVEGGIEIAVERDKFEYLAEIFSIIAFFPSDTSKNLPASGVAPSFTDAHFVEQEDEIAPVITLVGDNPLELNVGESYNEPGFNATDVREGPVTPTVASSDVDTLKSGFYTVVYSATDSLGNTASKERIVEVKGDAPQSTFEVKNLGALSESVLIDHQKNLVWANDDTKEEDSDIPGQTRGCLIMETAADEAELKRRFEDYCEKSRYAGFTDWRAPTPIELSGYTRRMDYEGIIPGMARSGCTRTLGIDVNGTVKAVWTHMMSDPGNIDTGTLTPSGGRCVRGNDGEVAVYNAPMADAGDDFPVDYNATFSFDASRSTDSDGQIVKYEWIFQDGVLNEGNTSSPIYTRLATQPIGHYEVLLRVMDNDGMIAEDTVAVEVN